jgi:hypothetical protein
MTHTLKPDFVFRRNGRVHLNQRGLQFSRLLAADVCASAVVMLDTPSSEVVWRVLDTHSIRQFSLHFPSHALPCAITFQLDTNKNAAFARRLQESRGCLHKYLDAGYMSCNAERGLNTVKPAWNGTRSFQYFFFRFHRFPFYKGLCFNKTKYRKYDRLGLQWRYNFK